MGNNQLNRVTIEELNNLESESVIAEFTKCCGAHNWVDRMQAALPFEDQDELLEKAEEFWIDSSESDWLEAFEHHPKIGDVNSLSKKFADTKEWAGEEQKQVGSATMEVIDQLAQLNIDYESKFGFIFIVCATGKSAKEMLEILQSRIVNDYQSELRIAMEEQQKITLLRLKKLLK